MNEPIAVLGEIAVGSSLHNRTRGPRRCIHCCRSPGVAIHQSTQQEAELSAHANGVVLARHGHQRGINGGAHEGNQLRKMGWLRRCCYKE